MLRQGDWDLLPEMESSLLPALDAVQRTKQPPGLVGAATEIIALQKKLEEAIHECQERKNQIAPLLDSLSRIREKTPDV